jgi:hypothetical protein
MRAQLPKSPVPSLGAEADGPVRELDRVRVLEAVTGDDDLTVPVGATGTVVAVYADGAAFEVEFTVSTPWPRSMPLRRASLNGRSGDHG